MAKPQSQPSSQPIALPIHNVHNSTNSVDYVMTSGSYSGSNNGSFNPASYTRHFLGSPVSWRAGSLGFGGSVFTSSSPMDHFIGSLEANDIKIRPSSLESDRGSIRGSFASWEREGELCRNYTCCGLHLNDLHALLEHFEEIHIVVVDEPSAPGGQQTQVQIPFNPQAVPPVQQTSGSGQAVSPGAGYSQHAHSQQQLQVPGQQQPGHSNNHYSTPFDVDDMEIDSEIPPPPSQSNSSRSSPSSLGSSGGSTPPDTPITTPLTVYPPTSYLKGPVPVQPIDLQQGQMPSSPYSPYASEPPSPHPQQVMGDGPIAAFETTHVIRRPSATTPHSTIEVAPNPNMNGRPSLNLNLSTFSLPSSIAPHGQMVEPFNTYARYAGDYSVGMSNMNGEGMGMDPNNNSHAGTRNSSTPSVEHCVPPALLFSNANTPESTPSTSRVPSPSHLHQHPSAGGHSPTSPNVPTGSLYPVTSTTATSIASSNSNKARSNGSMLLSKPFKCPKPNCNKSYKQANGLKYHITHGSCNFAPPKDLEHVQALLERKRRDRASAAEVDADTIAPSPTVTSPSSPGFPDFGQISEIEMREVEREAEKRLRPFACCVGDCTRRYKNMNGLRYHYQHSGEHGAVGLALLASGVHECLNNGGNGSNSREPSTVRGDRDGRKARGVGGKSSNPSSRSTSLTRTTTPVTPQSILAQAHQQQSQFITSQAPSGQTSLQQQARLTYQSTIPASSNVSLAAGTASVQAQAQLAYQQRYNEHQRVQYAQQHAQLQRQTSADAQQFQQMHSQFAALQSTGYPSNVDAAMSG